MKTFASRLLSLIHVWVNDEHQATEHIITCTPAYCCSYLSQNAVHRDDTVVIWLCMPNLFESFYSLVWKAKNIQWGAALWTEMFCWWERSEKNDPRLVGANQKPMVTQITHLLISALVVDPPQGWMRCTIAQRPVRFQCLDSNRGCSGLSRNQQFMMINCWFLLRQQMVGYKFGIERSEFCSWLWSSLYSKS